MQDKFFTKQQANTKKKFQVKRVKAIENKILHQIVKQMTIITKKLI